MALEEKVKEVVRVSPILQLIAWLDYPKLNRLNKTMMGVCRSEGNVVGMNVAIGALESKFILVSFGGLAVGWLLGRPAKVMAMAQVLLFAYQYWFERKLKN